MKRPLPLPAASHSGQSYFRAVTELQFPLCFRTAPYFLLTPVVIGCCVNFCLPQTKLAHLPRSPPLETPIHWSDIPADYERAKAKGVLFSISTSYYHLSPAARRNNYGGPASSDVATKFSAAERPPFVSKHRPSKKDAPASFVPEA